VEFNHLSPKIYFEFNFCLISLEFTSPSFDFHVFGLELWFSSSSWKYADLESPFQNWCYCLAKWNPLLCHHFFELEVSSQKYWKVEKWCQSAADYLNCWSYYSTLLVNPESFGTWLAVLLRFDHFKKYQCWILVPGLTTASVTRFFNSMFEVFLVVLAFLWPEHQLFVLAHSISPCS